MIASARTRSKKAPESPLKRKRGEILPSSRLLSPPDTEDSDLTDLEIIDSRCLQDRFRLANDSEAESLPSSSQMSHMSSQSRTTGAPPTPRRTPRPPPVDHFKRVIPLHGDLRTLACPSCKHVEQMGDHLEDLLAGEPVPCPQCSTFDDARAAAGARTRGVAMLKSSVVLYGEEHTEGERVGAVTKRDLCKGKRPDLLIVAGTTLKVPGTKKLVRELSKVIRPPKDASSEDDSDVEENADEDGDQLGRVHTIFLNNEFLSPATQWKDVFDVWVRGDVQEFVDLIETQRAVEDGEREAKAAKKLEMVANRQARADEKLAKAEERRLKAEEKERLAAVKAAKAASKGKGKAKTSTPKPKKPTSSATTPKKLKMKPEVVIRRAPIKGKAAAVKPAVTAGTDKKKSALTSFFVMGKPSTLKHAVEADKPSTPPSS